MNWNFVMADCLGQRADVRDRHLARARLEERGWIGLDRWLLSWLGTPWKPGRVFGRLALDAEPAIGTGR